MADIFYEVYPVNQGHEKLVNWTDECIVGLVRQQFKFPMYIVTAVYALTLYKRWTVCVYNMLTNRKIALTMTINWMAPLWSDFDHLFYRKEGYALVQISLLRDMQCGMYLYLSFSMYKKTRIGLKLLQQVLWASWLMEKARNLTRLSILFPPKWVS